MKLIAFITLLATVACGQDSAKTFTFTNAQGQAITARVAATNALTVFYDSDGGGGHIAWMDLPEATRTRLGYDPAAGQAAQQAFAARQQAAAAAQAESQRLAAWTGTPVKVRIVKTIGFTKYRIEFTRDRSATHEDVCIPSLPYETASFLTKINALREEIPNLRAGMGGLTPESRAMTEQKAEAAEHQLQEMAELEPSKTTLMLAPTRMQAYGLPIWKYMGVPTIDTPETTSAVQIAPPPSPRETLSSARQANTYGVPVGVYEQIRSKAERDYPNDFELQLFVIKHQCDAYRELHP